MVQFTKLRIAGFKSFVDPVEMLIEPGLTGIVGPNGCGKSNLVEALRWAMSESSAKAMRGGEMDDVIFGGTGERPARNIAEVSLHLDNRDRRAPSAFNDSEELEVARRIERRSGSNYRINGRDVRARDVALLFADSATGPRSTAIVSQGRIGSLVAARPTDRRALLEEAAGITGLHSRRHEAELRLRGAENNMVRLEDIVATLEGQLQGLKRQARQATRYRNISDHIRRAEAMYLHLRWQTANEAVAAAVARLEAAESSVNELTGQAAAAATSQSETAAGLPALRQTEAEAAAELHRLAVARDGLDTEEARVHGARREADTRIEQIATDAARESALAEDAAAALARLETEHAGLDEARESEEADAARARAAVEEAGAAAESLETELTALTARIAADETRRADLTRRLDEAGSRIRHLSERAAEIAHEQDVLRARAEAEPEAAGPEGTLDQAQTHLDDARARAEEAEEARSRATAAEAATREAMQTAEQAHTRLVAEEAALSALVAVGDEDMWPPVIDQITVDPGYETALGAALGDDLSAPADEGAPIHWRLLAPLEGPPALPMGAEPLEHRVKGADALRRRLSQTGLVPDEATGHALAPSLAPGQRLVSRDGAMWRWDGFTIADDANTAAATRLAQRARLEEVRAALVEAQARLGVARGRLEAAGEAATAAGEAATAARDGLDRAYAAVNERREAQAAQAERRSADSSRLAALEEAAERLRGELAEAEARETEARQGQAQAVDPEEAREREIALRAELTQRRARLIEARSTLDRLTREAEARCKRREDIGLEARSWQARIESAEHQRGQLEERRVNAQTEIARLAAMPQEIAARRDALLEHLTQAEAKRAAAADRLAEGEGALAAADTRLRAAEAALGQAREDRVRCEAGREQGAQSRQAIAERILERLECTPDGILEAGGVKEGETLPAVDVLEARVERLNRERQNMGPVNLRAEQEATEMGEQIQTLETERADLIAAINRLRHGIAELNREGRERLLASFEEVNRHFQELFTGLFGGGRAHLTLTNPDDPLEAGLEIMASPPGKRLQILSLLSGGERALTALALLFAVFLTNPAPICILDEVDAPLDDANVERFCNLLEEIARTSSTRFLLITHHRMSMARMDRLFGVTMPEPGVSRLVSVDLREAEALRATA